jgi:hypothetical protein
VSKQVFTSSKATGLYFNLLFIFLIGGFQSNAQKVGFGPKFGPNVSLLRGDFQVDGMQKPKFGFSAGGFMNVKWMDLKKFQLEVDLLYTMRGHRSEFFNTVGLDPDVQGPDLKSKYNYNLGYLEVPIIFKLMLNRGGMKRPYLFGGVTYAGILHSTFENGNSGKKTNALDFIKRDDLGINLGYGYTWFFIDRWYHFDIRYFHGLINSSDFIWDDLQPVQIAGNNRPANNINEFRNSTLSITFGVGLERSVTNFLR